MYTPDNAVRYELTLCQQAPLGEAVVDRAGETNTPLSDSGVIEGLQDIRNQLERLGDSDHPDDQATWQTIRHNFLSHDAMYMPPSLWTYEWQENAPDQVILASDFDLLQMLKWNVTRQREHQQRLDQDVRSLKEQALADVDTLIGYGLFPRHTRQLAQAAVMQSKVIALDSFEAGIRMCAGYYYISDGVVGMANYYRGGTTGFDDQLPGAQDTFTHEAGHAIEVLGNGGLRSIDPAESDIEELPYHVLNEAFVEHASQVARYGSPEVFAPANRHVDTGSYTVDRTLGQLLLCAGAIHIEPGLLGEAFVEPMHGKTPHARKKLSRDLRDSFKDILEVPGPNIVHAIALECAYVPAVKSDEVVAKWIERIVDATGYVNMDTDVYDVLRQQVMDTPTPDDQQD